MTAAQLAALGLSREAVRKRVEAGRLHRLHRGVYAVGHAAPSEARRFMAAVLACGRGAVLSHVSAAVLWGFLKPVRGPVHVSSPSRSGKAKRRGIVLHRPRSLGRGGTGARRTRLTTQRHRIPVTTPRRTIEDLEGTIEPRLWRRAKRQAEFAGHRLGLPSDRSRSDLERDFLAFLDRHRLPRPEVNVKLAEIGGAEVDFLWPRLGLVVETDFFDYHRGSVASEEDHRRELALRRAGYTVRRYTGAQLDDHPAEILADLREALAAQLTDAS